MGVNLNLLPENLTSKKGTVSLVKLLRSVTLISLILTIILGLGLVSFFLISSFELKSLEADVKNLEESVKAQQQTEQKIVLLKDRLGKIKSTKGASSLSKPLNDVKPVLDVISSDVLLGELNIDAQRIDTSMTFRDSIALSNFFEKLSTIKNFSQITLTSFGFNPLTGYLVGIRFNL